MSLKDLDTIYDQTTKAERKGIVDLPDGSYQVRVDKVKLEETENGNPMLNFDTIIQAGEFTGQHIFFNRVITENTLAHTKADLSMLGWGANKLSDLEDHNKLAILLDKWVEVRQVTKGTNIVNGKTYPNKNFYINRSLSPNVQTLTTKQTEVKQAILVTGDQTKASPITDRKIVHQTAGLKVNGLPDEPPF